MAEARAPDWRDMYSRQGLQVKNGGITLSANGYIKGGKTDYATGTGFFLGYSGGAYKFDIGSSTSYLRWTGTALSLIGDITGISNIDITGTAKFNGNSGTVGGVSYAVIVNLNGGASSGLYSKSTGGDAVLAESTSAGGSGAVASASGAAGVGVRASASGASGVALRATATGSATQALDVVGTMAINNSTLVLNLNADQVDGYHAGNSTGQVPISNGTVCTNLNADKLDGNDSSAFATSGHNHDASYLGISAKAADSNLLDGYDSAVFFRNDGTTTAGDPGAPTHTVNAVINGVTVRVHVSYP